MLDIRYNAHGLSFQYSAGLRVSAFPRPGRGVNIKVEGTGKHGHMFGFVAMTYLEPLTPQKAFAQSVQGIEIVYNDPPAKINKREPFKRSIAGVERTGERFEIEWDDHPVIELYAFELNGRTLCVSLQYDIDEAAKANDTFGPILGTLA